MNAIFELAEQWVRESLPHLWIASLAGLTVLGLLALTRRVSTGRRQLLAWSGLLFFVLPICWSANRIIDLLGWRKASAGVDWMDVVFQPDFLSAASGGNGHVSSVVSTDVGLVISPLAVVFCIWSFISVVLLGLVVYRSLRCHVEQGRVGEAVDTGTQRMIDGLAEDLGLKRRVYALSMPRDAWLGVVGVFRSRILIPRGLQESMSREEVESLLLHELAHVKRKDNLRRWVQSLIVSVFWFHPVVHLLHRSLLWESERACDEQVLRHGEHRERYEKGLIKAVQYALGFGLAGFSGMSNLRIQQRLDHVKTYKPRKDSVMKKLVTVLGLISLLAFVGFAGAEDVKEKKYMPSITAEEEALMIEAQQLADEDDREAAMNLLSGYLAAHPDGSAAIDYKLGRFFYNNGDMEDAVAWCNSALEKYPDFMIVHGMLGFIYLQQEKWEMSIDELNLLLASPGGGMDPRTYGLLGLCYLKLHQYEAAEEGYLKAIKADPDNADWYKGLAASYIGDRKVESDEFASVVKKLIVLNPDYADTYREWLENPSAAYAEEGVEL